MINKLKSAPPYKGAQEIDISIAVGTNAQDKNWKTISIPWANFVSALSEPVRTPETFQKYKSAKKEVKSKIKDVGGFMGGALNGPRRLNKSVTSRSLLTLDFDGHEGRGMEISLGELIEVYQERFNNEAVLYTTHSHEASNPRVRLVIPLRESIPPNEYKPLAQAVATELAPNAIDTASYVLSQFMFWPSSSKDGEYRFIHLPGELMDPQEILDQFEAESFKETSQLKGQALDWDAEISEWDDNKTISQETATEAVRQWTEKENENLKDYSNFLSAFMVIVKATQDKQISIETGKQCAELLAGERLDWGYQNKEKFDKELKTEVTTEKSFHEKFMFGMKDENQEQKSPKQNDLSIPTNDLVCYDDIEPQAVKWLWDGYIPLGMLSTIQGDPGGGKTYVSTGITAGISNGILPPDSFGVQQKIEPRNVLFINGEDSPEHTIRPRLDLAGANPKRVFTLKIDKDPLHFGQIKRIESAVKQIKPLLVVFDPIQQFLGQGVDMHRANEIRPILAKLKDLAAEYEFACVFVMHMNKSGIGKAQYRGLGSIDISAIMRAQFLVGENRNIPNGRLVVPIKNSLGMLQPAQGFNISDIGLTWTGPDLKATEEDVLMQANAKEGTELERAIQWLRTLLDESPMWSIEIADLAAGEEISQRTYERARSELKDKWEIGTAKAPGTKKNYWYKYKKKVIFIPGGTLAYEEENPEGKEEEVLSQQIKME